MDIEKCDTGGVFKKNLASGMADDEDLKPNFKIGCEVLKGSSPDLLVGSPASYFTLVFCQIYVIRSDRNGRKNVQNNVN